MACKLCLQNNPLCDSHIIPKHFFLERSKSSGFFQIGNRDPRKGKLPIGWYEKLLCRNCEEHFGRFDNYAAAFFRGFENWEVKQIKEFKLYKVNEYDYRLLKLFCMSVLWRASVASIPAFKDVSAGHLNEKLRLMLISDDPGGYEDFSTSLFVMQKAINQLHKVILAPRKVNHANTNYYEIKFNEFICWIKVSDNKHSEIFPDITLTENAPLLLMEYPFTKQRYEVMRDMVQSQPKRLKEYKERMKANRLAKNDEEQTYNDT